MTIDHKSRYVILMVKNKSLSHISQREEIKIICDLHHTSIAGRPQSQLVF